MANDLAILLGGSSSWVSPAPGGKECKRSGTITRSMISCWPMFIYSVPRVPALCKCAIMYDLVKAYKRRENNKEEEYQYFHVN